jgi:hypothetical protein
MKEAKLNQYLSSLCKSELEKEIVQLFKLYPEVKEYYDLKVCNNLEGALLEKYKKKIEEEFIVNKDINKVKYSVISEIIMGFQQVASEPSNIVKLMIYYVEKALNLINLKIDVKESFYLSVEGVFEKALKIVFKNELEEEFEDEIKKVIETISNQDFEFKDNMISIYSRYY